MTAMYGRSLHGGARNAKRCTLLIHYCFNHKDCTAQVFLRSHSKLHMLPDNLFQYIKNTYMSDWFGSAIYNLQQLIAAS